MGDVRIRGLLVPFLAAWAMAWFSSFVIERIGEV